MHKDCTQLDGKYACFGYVTEGMDIVDDICDNTPAEEGSGAVDKNNRPVIERITVID